MADARAREIMERISELRSRETFKTFDEKMCGVAAIMHMLVHAEGEVFAGDISSRLNMSTPRVAAALRTLESNGLIKRRQSESDARKVVVELTDRGRAEHVAYEQEMLELIDYILGEIGEEEFDKYLRISFMIKNALEKRFAKFDIGDTRHKLNTEK